MANPYFNQILNETTKLQTQYEPGETTHRELTNEDKEFLKNALDSVKGHNDVVKEIEEKMSTIELIVEHFEELEEYAFDIDIAYCMSMFGLFQKIEENRYKNVDLLQLAAVASQNNEKVQTAQTGFLVKYLHFLRTNDSDPSAEPNDSIILKPANISLLSALVRSHENNENVFKKSNGLSLLVDLVSSDLIRNNARMMTKILFFYKSVASKEEILIGLEPENLFKLHEDNVEYSRMLVELFELVDGDTKWEGLKGQVLKRRNLINT